MFNKKRQELIIQNLRSISSQVRLRSVEQLENLPYVPVGEKLRLLEGCLNDSEQFVREAAKVAITRLGGTVLEDQGGTSGSAVSENRIERPDKPSVGSGSFSLPSLFDLDAKERLEQANPLPAPSVHPAAGTSPKPSLAPATPDVLSAQQVQDPEEPPMGHVKPQPSPELKTLDTSSRPRSGSVLIDGAADPALPEVSGHSDIAFLLQHIKDISVSKPSGYLTRLYELCRSMHEEVALTALQTLYNLKDNRVSPYVLELLSDTKYSSQRRFLMLKIVMEAKVPLNIDLLENILINEKDVIVKSGLVKVFAKNCNESGTHLLIRCLKDEDPRVRANTVEVIESQNIRGCENEIIKLLNDSENRVKVNAAKYLVKIGYQQAFTTLRAMLISPEVWLRDSVIFALGEIADQPSLILLRAALKDPNQGIRLSVLKALARINNSASRQILKAAIDDPDPIVAQVAMSLFEKIKNEPIKEEQPIQKAAAVAPPQPQFQPQIQPIEAKNTPRPVATQDPSLEVQQQVSLPSLPEEPRQESSVPGLTAVAQPQSQPVAPQLPSQAQPQPQPVAPQLPSQPQSFAPQRCAATVLPQQPAVGTASGQGLPLASTAGSIAKQKASTLSALPPKTVPAGNNKVVSGGHSFEKPRSAEIYARLCSESVDEQKLGMKDIPFVMGQDQMILLGKAISLEDESIRIAAVKVLSRKRTPEAKELLNKLLADKNETISSLAKKALVILR